MNSTIKQLYNYNAWANQDLFAVLENIDRIRFEDEVLKITQLIGHYHIVSQIFSAHLQGIQHRHTTSDMNISPTLEKLRDAVIVSDEWYVNYVSHISSHQLSKPVPFAFTDGDRGCMTREEMLLHVALHSGHHRGEAGRILRQCSLAPPWDTFAVYLHRSEPERRLAELPMPSPIPSFTPR